MEKASHHFYTGDRPPDERHTKGFMSFSFCKCSEITEGSALVLHFALNKSSSKHVDKENRIFQMSFSTP